MIYSPGQNTRIKIRCAASSLIRGAEGLLFHFTLSKTGGSEALYNTDKHVKVPGGPPYKSDGDHDFWKIKIKSLRETSVGVAHA